jgi:HEAT repeat protein
MFKLEVEPKRKRSSARIGIWILGADARGAVPALSILAENPDRPRSWMAFELLGAIGVPAVPALNRLTDAPDPHVRTEALRTLREIRLRVASSAL